jgi:ABC-2 type transport system ATP-binding protein
MVFQEPSSDDILTGWENLYAHALMFGVPRRERRERISRVLRLVNMEDRAEDLVKKYSGGMRRRLELARGLLHNPRILLLDEPTLGLDPQTREHIWEYIEDLAKTNNVTVILTTHYMDEADRLCDRVAIIDHGKIVALDNPGRLKAQLGGEVVKIKSQTIDLGKLRGLDFISSVKQADGYVLLTVQKSSMHLQDILNRVGVVESVEVHPTTLNDVFLHYTGHEIRDESGEGGTMERIAQYEGRSR